MARIIKVIPEKFDWNTGNQEKNLIKHKVNYHECEQVFFNKPLRTFTDKKHSKTETRLMALGKTNKKRRLTIIFTIRNKKIRVISAREMSRKERKTYEQKNKH